MNPRVTGGILPDFRGNPRADGAPLREVSRVSVGTYPWELLKSMILGLTGLGHSIDPPPGALVAIYQKHSRLPKRQRRPVRLA